MSSGVIILRDDSNARRTLGQFFAPDGTALAQTLELPYRDNATDVSCIPAGSYTMNLRFSEKHQRDLWHIDGVPDRAQVEIHVGNSTADTEGCVLVGGDRDGDRICDSREALERVMAYLEPATSYPLTVADRPELA